MKPRALTKPSSELVGYGSVLGELVALIESARRAAARSVNAVITATYFLVGRAIVEHEQKGGARAAYGEQLLERLVEDLSARFGRGFSRAASLHPHAATLVAGSCRQRDGSSDRPG